jgi:hypothetical protein
MHIISCLQKHEATLFLWFKDWIIDKYDKLNRQWWGLSGHWHWRNRCFQYTYPWYPWWSTADANRLGMETRWKDHEVMTSNTSWHTWLDIWKMIGKVKQCQCPLRPHHWRFNLSYLSIIQSLNVGYYMYITVYISVI